MGTKGLFALGIVGGVLVGMVMAAGVDSYFEPPPAPAAAEILTYEVAPQVLQPGGEAQLRVVSRRHVNGCKVSVYRQIGTSDGAIISFGAADVTAAEAEPGVFETRTTVRIPEGLTPGPARLHSVAFYDCGERGTHMVLTPWVDVTIVKMPEG